MKRNRFLYPVLLLLLFSATLYSQTESKIRFQKEHTLIYFFQKGVKSDTLSKKSENLFYLLVSDSLKKNLVVEVENGQLIATGNDSLVKLNYVQGFKYESFYVKRQDYGTAVLQQKAFEYQTLVNGISILTKERIHVILRDKVTGQIIIENNFFVN